MKKKLVVFALVVMFLFSIAGSAFAAPAVNVVKSPCTDLADDDTAVRDFALLNALRIFEGYGDGTVGPANTLTRAEFSKVVIAMMNMKSAADALSTLTPAFTDAAAIPTWARGWINAAHAGGIIVGRTDGSFDAGAPVAFAEATTMLVRALGYERGVMSPWPAAHIAKGANIGLTEGLTIFHQVPITREEMAIMTANALTIERPDRDGDPKEGSELLYDVFGMKQEQMVDEVTANRIKIEGKWYDFGRPVALFGAASLADLERNEVDFYARGGAIYYIELSETKAIRGIFDSWLTRDRLRLQDGRTFEHLPFENGDSLLQVSVNDGGFTSAITRATRTDYVDEKDEVRLHLGKDDVVEKIEVYFDTFKNILITEAELDDDDDPEFGEVDLKRFINPTTSQNAKGLNVDDTTKVMLDGDIVTLEELVEAMEDFRDRWGDEANAIATVRIIGFTHADAFTDAGGEDLHTLSVIMENIVSGEVTARASDYVRIDGVKVNVDTKYLRIGTDLVLGEDVTLLLGSDDKARVLLETVPVDDVYFAKLLEYTAFSKTKLEADVLVELADGGEVRLRGIDVPDNLDDLLGYVVVIEADEALYEIHEVPSGLIDIKFGYYSESTATWLRLKEGGGVYPWADDVFFYNIKDGKYVKRGDLKSDNPIALAMIDGVVGYVAVFHPAIVTSASELKYALEHKDVEMILVADDITLNEGFTLGRNKKVNLAGYEVKLSGAFNVNAYTIDTRDSDGGTVIFHDAFSIVDNVPPNHVIINNTGDAVSYEVSGDGVDSYNDYADPNATRQYLWENSKYLRKN